MKLLQILNEAVTAKSKTTASEVTADAAQISALAKGVVAHLKKTFGKDLMDKPMAVITQHARSQGDAAMGTRLSKDDLETVTNKVLANMKPHLTESDEMLVMESDDVDLVRAAIAVVKHNMTLTDAAKKFNVQPGELKGEVGSVEDSISSGSYDKLYSKYDTDLHEAKESKEKADDRKVEAHGVKGMKSTPWRKTFKNQAEFEKWCDKHEGDIEVQGYRILEQVSVKEGSGAKEKQHSKYVDRSSPESTAKSQAAREKMAADEKAEPGKALADKIAQKKSAD